MSQLKLLPAGLYDGEIEAWKDLGLVATPFGQLPKIEVRFRVTTPEGAQSVARRYALNFARKSHLSRDVEILLGEFPRPGFDFDRLVGVRCQLSVGIDEFSTKQRHRIRGLFPARETGLEAVFDVIRRYSKSRDSRK